MSILNDIVSSDEDASSQAESPERSVIFRSTSKSNITTNKFRNSLLSSVYSKNTIKDNPKLEKWRVILLRLKLLYDKSDKSHTKSSLLKLSKNP
tara:strand:- start:598 stop:879 length:282 start_codon:yes stop_codon:yes gene_type:complete